MTQVEDEPVSEACSINQAGCVHGLKWVIKQCRQHSWFRKQISDTVCS